MSTATLPSTAEFPADKKEELPIYEEPLTKPERRYIKHSKRYIAFALLLYTSAFALYFIPALRFGLNWHSMGEFMPFGRHHSQDAHLEGPFYLPNQPIRADIAASSPGLPMTLDIIVVNSDNLEPMQDIAVDLWHADATGRYSGFEQHHGKKHKGGKKHEKDDKNHKCHGPPHDGPHPRPPHGPPHGPPHDGPHGPPPPPHHGPPRDGPHDGPHHGPPHGPPHDGPRGPHHPPPPPHHGPPHDGPHRGPHGPDGPHGRHPPPPPHHRPHHNHTHNHTHHDNDHKHHRSTFLRGIQFSDANGHVQFTSIFPGGYHGRSVHLHYKLHRTISNESFSNDEAETIKVGQLYFDDEVVKTIHERSEYSSSNDLELSDDDLFDGEGMIQVISLEEDKMHAMVTIVV